MADWITKPGNLIDLDLSVSWETLAGDQINIDFSPQYCPQKWLPADPLHIEFFVDKEWEEKLPYNVDFDFRCEGGGPPPINLFTGFFDFGVGEVHEATLLETFIVTGRSGETFNFAINDFSGTMPMEYHTGETFLFTINDFTGTMPMEYRAGEEFNFAINDFSGTISPLFGDGSSLQGGSCDGTAADFTSFDSFHNTGSSINPVFPVSFVQSVDAGDGYAGANVSGGVRNLTGLSEISLSWDQTLTGTWYDNDNTDAACEFGFVFADDIADIVTSTALWRYRNPFLEETRTSNPRMYHAWLPFGTTVNGWFCRKDPSATSNYQNWTKTSGVNLYDGTHRITFTLRKHATTGNAILEFWIDSTLIKSYDYGDPFPTYVIPVWHYHNYASGTNYVTVSNLADSSCSDLLTTYPSGNMLPDMYAGERVEFELSAAYNLPISVYTGETVFAHLSADQQLTDITGRIGEELLAVLATRPAVFFDPSFYVGETGSASLSTTHVLSLDAGVGEASLADLDTRPAPELLFEAKTGETSAIAISFAQALGTFNSYTGEQTTLEPLDEVELWRSRDGATLVADLSTQTTLPQDHLAGEMVYVDLNIRPSEGMGTFRAYADESGVLDLKTLVAVYLYPNRISTRTEIFCDFDSSTKFDLLDTTCCPVKESHEIIELLHGPAPDEHYDGDKTIAVMDLSTRPRFQFNFTHGEHAKTVNPMFLGFLLMADGQDVGVNYIDLEITDFKLCPGNFIPDPEFTFIELSSTYDEACEADFVFVGETMKVQLQNNIDPGGSLQQHGEYMTIEFETPWLLRAWTGEHARVSNPEFTILAFAGEAIPGFNMYDAPYQAGTGEFASITGLTVEYFAEFLEVGCLDNEFVPSNENGDPDMENFNPVPTEGEEFSHSILARCF